jgi:hypothetical protein
LRAARQINTFCTAQQAAAEDTSQVELKIRGWRAASG